VNQTELKQMSEERLKDAKVLIDGARWEFAYYAAGYAVECAIKSCMLARMVHTGWIFDSEAKKSIEDCRIHDFIKLLRIASLVDELNARLRESATKGDGFVANWEKAKAWTVDSRYEARSEADARSIYAAITDEPDGVLRWIQKYW
jgi:HEPN domain-containing protein